MIFLETKKSTNFFGNLKFLQKKIEFLQKLQKCSKTSNFFKKLKFFSKTSKFSKNFKFLQKVQIWNFFGRYVLSLKASIPSLNADRPSKSTISVWPWKYKKPKKINKFIFCLRKTSFVTSIKSNFSWIEWSMISYVSIRVII